MKKKVAILGCTASRKDAPYDDKDWEIWTCNEFEPPRFDRMFELHPIEVQNPAELEYLKACEKPVYVLQETPLVPKGIEYPLEEVLDQPWAKDYFTCTFAFEIALAIHEGFETIGLWGMNAEQASPRERTIESACVQWWMGLAQGMGIEVIWPDDPAEWRHRYGYDYAKEKYAVEDWLCRLAIHTIYRVGPVHTTMGGMARNIGESE